MTKARKRKTPARAEIVGPTDAQLVNGEYESALLAYKRVVAIQKLRLAKTLTQRQYDGLARYRDVAIAEERSFTRDSLDKALHGGFGGSGMGCGAIRTAIELGRLEQALGSLRPIARAIAVDDLTLSQWAMQQGGSIMRDKPGIGRAIITWFEPRRKAKDAATLEIRMAGDRLAAAIGA